MARDVVRDETERQIVLLNEMKRRVGLDPTPAVTCDNCGVDIQVLRGAYLVSRWDGWLEVLCGMACLEAWPASPR